MNIKQWIDHVTDRLESSDVYYGHGTDNPVDEAAWLVLHAVGAPVDGSFELWEQSVAPEQESVIQKYLLERLEQGLPLAYILGSAWFAGLEFVVNRNVLVPRSPVAELILERFVPWVDCTRIQSVLDLCTGCGCIGIAVAVHLPWVRVDAADISGEALQVAKQNVQRFDVQNRVELYQSDLFAALGGKRYDLILTNPPYVPRSAVADLPREYGAEPELGLVSGDDGLDACLLIMLQTPQHLNDEGLLVCEVGESEQRLATLLPQVPFLWLEFSNGGTGVFILSKQELEDASSALKQVIGERNYVA